MRRRHIADEANSSGRYNLKYYGNAPYYIWPSTSEQWSVQACIYRVLGKPLPGDEGDRYCPQGYLIGEVGPNHQVGKGSDDMKRIAEDLKKGNRGGCPFPG